MTVQRLLCLLVSRDGQPRIGNLTCPICGTPIELKTGLNRLMIEKLSEACESVDAVTRSVVGERFGPQKKQQHYQDEPNNNSEKRCPPPTANVPVSARHTPKGLPHWVFRTALHK